MNRNWCIFIREWPGRGNCGSEKTTKNAEPKKFTPPAVYIQPTAIRSQGKFVPLDDECIMLLSKSKKSSTETILNMEYDSTVIKQSALTTAISKITLKLAKSKGQGQKRIGYAMTISENIFQ